MTRGGLVRNRKTWRFPSALVGSKPTAPFTEQAPGRALRPAAFAVAGAAKLARGL